MEQPILASGEFFALGVIILVIYHSVGYLIRRRKGKSRAPVTIKQLEEMNSKLPEHLRTSPQVIQSTYDLFGGCSIRFSYRAGDPPEEEDRLPTTIRIIIDEKLCLFFWKDDPSAVQWVYDGYEAGDYTNDFRDETVR